MTDRERTVAESMLDALGGLVGSWSGTGRGDHPPIDPFRYREELFFSEHGLDPLWHFEQRTWLLDEAGRETEPAHWESGFLLLIGGNRVEMTNAQNGVRVEVLGGPLTLHSDGVSRLVLDSLLHGHDARVLRTRRTFTWAGNDLSYRVAMATVQTPELTEHLTAELTRT